MIMAALYPPACSTLGQQHKNRTSELVGQTLQGDNFDWIDLFPRAPTEHNGQANDHDFEKIVAGMPAVSLDWWDRVTRRTQQLLEEGHPPVVYVAGRICRLAYEGLCQRGTVARER